MTERSEKPLIQNKVEKKDNLNQNKVEKKDNLNQNKGHYQNKPVAVTNNLTMNNMTHDDFMCK